jgi:hypothetical protein
MGGRPRLLNKCAAHLTALQYNHVPCDTFEANTKYKSGKCSSRLEHAMQCLGNSRAKGNPELKGQPLMTCTHHKSGTLVNGHSKA